MKEPPRDPASQHVEDGVQDLAQGPLARSPSDARLWHVRLDQSPFGIGQISFVTQPFAAMLPPSGRGWSMTRRGALTWIVLSSVLLFAPQSLSQPIGIVALGDSNTAGFGVGRDQAYPAHLERMLRAAGHDVQVWNAGVTGDT